MAKSIKEEVSLSSNNPEIRQPRIVKLIIKNYRCIGSQPVEVDLNDIVVLVGSNNVGKSTILKAYELIMNHGSAKGKLSKEDFPKGVVDAANPPEIELHTIVFDNSPGDVWIENTADGEKLVKEKWVWLEEGEPKRHGWDVKNNQWSDKVPWGAPNIAKSRRPEPHRVDAFASPENQTDEIKKILKQALEERVKTFKSDDSEETEFKKLLQQIKKIQKGLLAEAKTQIDKVNNELTALIEKVFPNYVIDFDARPEDNVESSISFFKAESQLLMGHKEGFLSTVDRQGSGARRTLLWTALKYLAENNTKKKPGASDERPHLLLLDEPEICLHPNAIRDACNVLYSLPHSNDWQIMLTTHSPVFIDFSKDNTTIVRVERNSHGEIFGTTLFRPDKVKLTEDDKLNLKLLNIADPYVAEFLFGGKIVIVEGDTEYTAFKTVIAKNPNQYRNVHVVRARGKATIVSLLKILNHFGANYSVLHDSDTPKIKKKAGGFMTNPAWTINQNILSEVNNKPDESRVKLIASLKNFEYAFLGDEVDNEKPYHALRKVLDNDALSQRVSELLSYLIGASDDLPKNCFEWSDLALLEKKVLLGLRE